MKTSASKLLVVASLAAVASFGARADDADASQYVLQPTGSATRAQVQAELAQFRKGANPWSTQYNPLAKFKSEVTRAQVQAAYIADRDQVAALSGEDSGSAYLARQGGRSDGSTRLARLQSAQ